eukprot:1149234-Pelagomonas_calceolata.AAC.3
MAADYGFRAGAGRLYEEHYGEVPSSVIELVSCFVASFRRGLIVGSELGTKVVSAHKPVNFLVLWRASTFQFAGASIMEPGISLLSTHYQMQTAVSI